MGAAASEIDVVTDRDDGGGVSVVATWIKAAEAEDLREEADRAGLLAMKPDDEPLQRSASGEPLHPGRSRGTRRGRNTRLDEPAP